MTGRTICIYERNWWRGGKLIEENERKTVVGLSKCGG